MIVEETSYVEHFGVKGMKWGVRKEKTTNGTRKPLSRNQKIALGVGGAVVVAAGAYAVKRILGMDKSKTVATMLKESPTQSFSRLMSPSDLKFAADKPFRDATRKKLITQLKPDQFIRWSETAKNYVIDNERGYNPITNTFGR